MKKQTVSDSVTTLTRAQIPGAIRSILALTRGHAEELRCAAKPMAVFIGESIDPSEAAHFLFTQVLGEKTAAERSNATEAARQIAAGWNTVKPTLRHHLKEIFGLAVSFDNLQTPIGVSLVEPLDQAADRAKAKRDQMKAARAAALATFQADQTRARIESLRDNNPQQMTDEIVETLLSWSSNGEELHRVLIAVGDAIDKALAPKPARKPRAKRNVPPAVA